MTIIFKCLAMAKEGLLASLDLISYHSSSSPATYHTSLFYAPQMHMALSSWGFCICSSLCLEYLLIPNPFHTVTWFFLWYFKSKTQMPTLQREFPWGASQRRTSSVPTTSHFLSHCTISSSSWHLTLSAVILFVSYVSIFCISLIIMSTTWRERIWQPVFFCLIPRTLSRAQHMLGDQ